MTHVIIDVREPEEFESGHVRDALNIPVSRLKEGDTQLSKIAKDTPIVMYCRSGSRSNVAIHLLKDMGYTNLTNGTNKEQVEAKYL